MKKLKNLLNSLLGWAFVIALFSPIAMLIGYNLGWPSLDKALHAVVVYIISVLVYALGLWIVFCIYDLVDKWLH